MPGPGRLDAGAAGVGDFDVVAVAAQDQLQRPCGVAVVLDDQDAHPFSPRSGRIHVSFRAIVVPDPAAARAGSATCAASRAIKAWDLPFLTPGRKSSIAGPRPTSPGRAVSSAVNSA